MLRAQCALALLALCVGLAYSWETNASTMLEDFEQCVLPVMTPELVHKFKVAQRAMERAMLDLALSMGDQLQFYTDGNKTDTVLFKSQNLWALVHDDIHNMILYIEKHTNDDAVCGFNLTSMQYKCITERNGRNIRGLAFDPATEKLFFSDLNEKSINWFSLKPGATNNVYGNLLIKIEDGIPTDIAVDSCRGYIYWINTNLTTPTIERARFNGSEREVVTYLKSLSINTTHTMEPNSLVIDQQSQKMFWVEPKAPLKYGVYRADLDGKRRKERVPIHFVSTDMFFKKQSNVNTVSKTSLLLYLWEKKGFVVAQLKIGAVLIKELFRFKTEVPIGIAANYKISDQVQGLTNCEVLTSLVKNNSVTDNLLKIATEVPFCVHGLKDDGQSRCKCTPGYIGVRCDVSVCENYCLHGTCSINDEGLPNCRCHTSYSGERCDFKSCQVYCLHNGDRSLNENSEPVCECKGSFTDERCEVSDCLNYCVQGNCSFNDTGLPTCSCDAGYSGERCEVFACHGFCLNDGDCTINEDYEPVCRCHGNHEGSRCEVGKPLNNTVSNITVYDSGTSQQGTRNFTLTDLLSNWRKSRAKVTVTVEV